MFCRVYRTHTGPTAAAARCCAVLHPRTGSGREGMLYRNRRVKERKSSQGHDAEQQDSAHPLPCRARGPQHPLSALSLKLAFQKTAPTNGFVGNVFFTSDDVT